MPGRDSRPRIAVTMGDPAGVGPELCLRLLAETPLHEIAVPIVFGDPGVLEAAAQACGLPGPPPAVALAALNMIDRPAVLPLTNLGRDHYRPKHVSAGAGAAAFAYIEAAIREALAGNVSAVVTAPIHKEALAAAGVPFPGHTEILADRTAAPRHAMMLTADAITCTLVTAHVGYREVADLLSVERIVEAIDLTRDAMRRIRGREPRLVVCGLNPHAGEHGLFGDSEEERIIAPAVERARAAGATIVGPIPPDTAFLPWRRAETDAYLCMYHDQGLIPLKALAFDEAINITLGLPIVRTSVDHGTAFDIAWTGQASPNSLYRAFELAARLATSRTDRDNA